MTHWKSLLYILLTPITLNLAISYPLRAQNLVNNSSSPKLDVNDVSILFPLAKNQNTVSPYPNISFDKRYFMPALLKQILSATSNNKVFKSFGIGYNKSFRSYEKWRVVGIRYDSCFPIPAENTTLSCMQQLRLIAQPFDVESIGDTALHLLYLIPGGSDSKLEVIKSLISIQKLSGNKTSGVALNVHPGLKAELELNKSTLVADEVNKLISKYALLKNLVGVALADNIDSFGPWLFISGTVNEGKWTLRSVNGLKNTVTMEIQDSSGFQPLTLSHYSNTNPILSEKNKKKYSYDELLDRIENPKISNIQNMNCISCHSTGVQSLTSSPTKYRYTNTSGVNTEIKFDLSPAKFTPNDGGGGEAVVRIFGYFNTNPIIAPAAVYSSGEVAESLNVFMKEQIK